MYRILCDNEILYNPLLEDYLLSSAELEKTVNKAGMLSITFAEDNKAIGKAKLLKSKIELFDDDKLLFSGRPYAPSRNLFNEKELLVAGELSYFNDTIHEPFDYFGPVRQFFAEVINNHNSLVSADRQFKVGVCDVTNDTVSGNIVRSSEEVMTTWEILDKKLVSMLGGYLRTRHEADGVYIDYLENPVGKSDQKIQQCINLLDCKEEITSDELYSAIYPLGARIDDTTQRVTVTRVNGGSPFVIDTDKQNLYGFICKSVVFDDITEPANLLKAAKKELNSLNFSKSLKIKAVDLAKAGYNINSFDAGYSVSVSIDSMKIAEDVVIDKIKINLLEPEKSTLEVGKEVSVTDVNLEASDRITESIVKSNAAEHKAEENLNVIEETKRVLENTIVQSADTLRTEISDSTYTKKDTDDLVSQKLTEFEQDPESFSYRFVEYDKTLSEHNQRIEERESYINFENGNIKLGKSDSNASTTITNEQYQIEIGGKITTYVDSDGTHSRNVEVENQISHFGNWATCKGAKSSKGNNLNVMWIGG